MAKEFIQPSFNAGEWAPQLYARVDLAKYKAGAALLENFFVDYRGGASTRAGTRYILQCLKSNKPVRVISFQASFDTSYVMEFGDFYIRFYTNGAPVLETALNITGATKANPCVVSAVNSYAVGDVVYISGVVGMTQLNGKYFKVSARTAGTITLADLNDVAINSTAYGTYVSGGTVQRVYTIVSPYAAEDLATLKFAQNVSVMVLTHPSYAPYVLTLVSATNWTLIPMVIGASIDAPTGGAVGSTLAAGTANYAYVITSVDANGQESPPSSPINLLLKQDFRTVAGTNTVSWTARTGAKYYNVYRGEISYAGAVPAGSQFGYIGFSAGTSLVDTNIAADFSQTPPIAQNPFQGAGVESVTVTTPGTYTTVPTVTIADAPAGGSTATAIATLIATNPVLTATDPGFGVGTIMLPRNGAYGGLQMQVTAVDGAGRVTSAIITNPGGISAGAVPANAVQFYHTGSVGLFASFNLTWIVGSVSMTANGSGYTSIPAVSFSSGAAAGTAVLGDSSAGNPSVPTYFQQRLVLAALSSGPQTFHMSQTGSSYNFNIRNPIQGDDAISASLVSGQLNTIKALISMPPGLVVLSDKAAWLINGGSAGEAVTPANVTAHAHSYNGANDVQPIVANSDILYVQAKGSSVRNLTYNFYQNIFTGTDITVYSSHLFFGYEILEWAWAEEPFKVAWAIRDDGTLLSLTFMKEQEFVGWAHSITDGWYKSVANVIESIDGFGSVDAVYFVIEREINGNTVKYIERAADRFFETINDCWCVDAALSYTGTPATTFSGGEHLAGMTVTGLADGEVIPEFVMPANGNFTLTSAASHVVVGLPFTAKLQTLPIDLGEPTVQGKVKQIPAVDIKVAQALGLKIGSDFDHLVEMKDLKMGEVSSMLTGQSSQLVEDLVSGDARTIIDATYTVPGQYCIQQDQPYPATILGVVPQITVGDTKR